MDNEHMMMKKPEMEPQGGGYMARVMSGMKFMNEEDLEPVQANIPVEAEDGEQVAMLMYGTAKGGFLTNPMSALIDLGETESQPNRLKKMLSEEDANEEE